MEMVNMFPIVYDNSRSYKTLKKMDDCEKYYTRELDVHPSLMTQRRKLLLGPLLGTIHGVTTGSMHEVELPKSDTCWAEILQKDGHAMMTVAQIYLSTHKCLPHMFSNYPNCKPICPSPPYPPPPYPPPPYPPPPYPPPLPPLADLCDHCNYVWDCQLGEGEGTCGWMSTPTPCVPAPYANNDVGLYGGRRFFKGCTTESIEPFWDGGKEVSLGYACYTRDSSKISSGYFNNNLILTDNHYYLCGEKLPGTLR